MSDDDKRDEKYRAFAEIVKDDVPAAFVYSPDLTYALPKDIGGVTIGHVVTPSERFITVHTWYLEKANVWKIFVK